MIKKQSHRIFIVIAEVAAIVFSLYMIATLAIAIINIGLERIASSDTILVIWAYGAVISLTAIAAMFIILYVIIYAAKTCYNYIKNGK